MAPDLDFGAKLAYLRLWTGGGGGPPLLFIPLCSSRKVIAVYLQDSELYTRESLSAAASSWTRQPRWWRPPSRWLADGHLGRNFPRQQKGAPLVKKTHEKGPARGRPRETEKPLRPRSGGRSLRPPRVCLPFLTAQTQ